MALNGTPDFTDSRYLDSIGKLPPQSPTGLVPFNVKIDVTYTGEIDTVDTEIVLFQFPTGAYLPVGILGALGGVAGDGTSDSLDTGTTAALQIGVVEEDGTAVLAYTALAHPTDISLDAHPTGYVDVGGHYLSLGVATAGTVGAGDALYVNVYGLITWNIFHRYLDQ